MLRASWNKYYSKNSLDVTQILTDFLPLIWGCLVRSGQVRSECLTCTFRASCCSARLSQAQVPTFAGSSVWDRKKRGDRLHWWVQGSTSSPTRIGSRRRVVWGVMEFRMSRRIKAKGNMCAFQWKKIGVIWTVCRMSLSLASAVVPAEGEMDTWDGLFSSQLSLAFCCHVLMDTWDGLFSSHLSLAFCCHVLMDTWDGLFSSQLS